MTEQQAGRQLGSGEHMGWQPRSQLARPGKQQGIQSLGVYLHFEPVCLLLAKCSPTVQVVWLANAGYWSGTPAAAEAAAVPGGWERIEWLRGRGYAVGPDAVEAAARAGQVRLHGHGGCVGPGCVAGLQGVACGSERIGNHRPKTVHVMRCGTRGVARDVFGAAVRGGIDLSRVTP